MTNDGLANTVLSAAFVAFQHLRREDPHLKTLRALASCLEDRRAVLSSLRDLSSAIDRLGGVDRWAVDNELLAKLHYEATRT